MYCRPLTIWDDRTAFLEELQVRGHPLEDVDCLNAFYLIDSPFVAHNCSAVEEADQLRNEKMNCLRMAWSHTHQSHSVLQGPLMFVVSVHFFEPWCMSDQKPQETKDRAQALVIPLLVFPCLPKKTSHHPLHLGVEKGSILWHQEMEGKETVCGSHWVAGHRN